jgi:hypothetical protein
MYALTAADMLCWLAVDVHVGYEYYCAVICECQGVPVEPPDTHRCRPSNAAFMLFVAMRAVMP